MKARTMDVDIINPYPYHWKSYTYGVLITNIITNEIVGAMIRQNDGSYSVRYRQLNDYGELTMTHICFCDTPYEGEKELLGLIWDDITRGATHSILRNVYTSGEESRSEGITV